MNDVLCMFLGALLVSIGVLASAVADRIRQLRIDRTPAREPREIVRQIRAPRAAVEPEPPPGADDVIAALVGAGYKKATAAQAAAACTMREQMTPESWLTAALRRCAQ